MSAKKNNSSRPSKGVRKGWLPAKDSRSIVLSPDVVKGKKVKSKSDKARNDKRKSILLVP